MLPGPDICRHAHRARDPRFDGRFVIGVLTTGVFCRPICPARLPREDNVRYYATPAAALAAGYRPCRRCRPEAAPPLPEWTLGSGAVLRALRLVDDGYLDDHSCAELASATGTSARHLRRLFAVELGAGPATLARARRLLLARRLIDESDLGMTEVAMSAGYGSVRRFNADCRTAFGQPPSALRRRKARASAAIALHLPLRRPYHAAWLVAFLARRALPGLEAVAAGRYRRRIGAGAWIEAAPTKRGLRISIPSAAVGCTADLLVRLRRLFDLDADPEPIDAHLARQPLLAPLVRKMPGIRVPGVWDAFEGAVRAILGQQVSVARATALAATLCQRFGDGAFPAADALARADVAAIGLPGVRGRAVSEVARRVAAKGDGWLKDAHGLRRAFAEIRGLGPWSAEYAALRIGRDPDAFPEADWGVLQALGCKAAAARRWAAPCRPWRAYAVMHLWASRT